MGGDGIYLDDFAGLSAKCSIYAVSDDYTGKSMTNPTVPMKYKPTSISAPVQIGRHCIIGCNSVVLPGVVIEDGASVGSLSLVTKSLSEWTVNTGVPCKKKSDRSRDILELEKQYFEDMKKGDNA